MDPNQESNQNTIPTSEKQIKIFCGQEYIIPLSVAQTSTLIKVVINKEPISRLEVIILDFIILKFGLIIL